MPQKNQEGRQGREQSKARRDGSTLARVHGKDPRGLSLSWRTTAHGGQPRGSDFHPGSALFEGRFGRMFRTLPPADFDDDDLKALANIMIADHEAKPTPETEPDDEEYRGISAGYTYLGQFIDHDLTLDPASSLDKHNDADALEDFRTPRFDLDSLYGRGPNDRPYLYEDNGLRMLLGEQLTGSVDHTGKVDKGTRDPVIPDEKLRVGKSSAGRRADCSGRYSSAFCSVTSVRFFRSTHRGSRSGRSLPEASSEWLN